MIGEVVMKIQRFKLVIKIAQRKISNFVYRNSAQKWNECTIGGRAENDVYASEERGDHIRKIHKMRLFCSSIGGR